MQRYNALRNFIAHHARCSGAAVHIEQTTAQDVLAELSVTAEDRTRARRLLHTADVHIFDTQARQVWLDVRVTVPPSAAGRPQHLAAAERAKAGEYGFRLNEPADIHTGVRPFVLDPRGGLGKQATAVSGYLIRLRAAHLRMHNAVQPAEALRLAEASFWTPLSCLLLQARWHGTSMCTRGLVPDWKPDPRAV